ncbi:restin homolog [Sabethes cyaneus]|uniref:restin homolog n=1 Tax=Sabethes cyaneus TaxID=53552 RepID=UPI00237D4769|nr:restin homolog [Sabethes cyaneus]
MDNQEFMLAKNDFDLENIRSRLIKCICELQSRRNEVTLLKSSLDECSQSRHGLEQDAKNFQREVTDLRDQLKIALDALNQKNSVRTGVLENAARQNVQLEALTNDHERLKAKFQTSQTKIMELTRENNKLQGQLKVLQTSHNQPVESVDRIWKAMDTLNGHLQKLEAEHVLLTQTAESSKKLAEEAALAITSSRNELVATQEKNRTLEQQVLELKAKIISLQTVEQKPSTNEEEVNEKFENHLKTLTDELENERESNRKLKADISSLLTLQDCLTRQLEEAVQLRGDIVRQQTPKKDAAEQPEQGPN